MQLADATRMLYFSCIASGTVLLAINKGEPLISLEYFLANPTENLAKLSNFFDINSNQVVDIPVPVELGIAYSDKFKNYDEIVEWFENYE